MPRNPGHQLRVLLLALTGLLAALPALAATIHVPLDQSSIQDAIFIANFGDRVVLAPGEYHVDLELKGGITLAGSGARPEDTVLLGAPPGGQQGAHNIAHITNDSRPLRIENLQIEGGMARNGGGIVISDGCSVQFSEVVFLANGADIEGGAIYARNSHIELYNCVFHHNWSQGGGGGSIHFQVDPGYPGLGTSIIENCTFAANSGCCGATSLVMDGGVIDVSHSIIENVTCLGGVQATFGCNNGDLCGIDAGGNIAQDPRFCGFEYGDYHLEPDSPCLPVNSAGCGLIGAYSSCITSATARTSFSTVKALFR